MPRLTQLEKTRMALVAITLLAPLATCGVALWKASAEEAAGLPYPLQAALGNVVAAYVPVLVIVFGFLWMMGKRPKPPRGDAAMDLTANVVAVFVFAVTLGIPVLIYGTRLGAVANEAMVLYSSLMHTLLSAAMVYYFGKPLVEERSATEQRRTRAPAARR